MKLSNSDIKLDIARGYDIIPLSRVSGVTGSTLDTICALFFVGIAISRCCSVMEGRLLPGTLLGSSSKAGALLLFDKLVAALLVVVDEALEDVSEPLLPRVEEVIEVEFCANAALELDVERLPAAGAFTCCCCTLPSILYNIFSSDRAVSS